MGQTEKSTCSPKPPAQAPGLQPGGMSRTTCQNGGTRAGGDAEHCIAVGNPSVALGECITELACAPAVPLLSVCSKELKAYDHHMHVFMAA